MLAGKREYCRSSPHCRNAAGVRKTAMSSGGWTAAQGTEVAETGDYGQRSTYALRPLSLGEILDRSFAVYRANFWLFIGIGSLSAVVQLIANAIQLVIFHGIVPNQPQVQLHLRYQVLGRQIGGGITGLLVFLISALTQAATVWALSEVYLGRRTTIAASIRAVIGRWLRFLGIGLWQGWSAIWLPLLVAGPGFFLLLGPARVRSAWIGGALVFLGMTAAVVFGVIAFLRNSLAVQAAVLEHLNVRAAMRRSKVLAAGAKGRLFVVYLIAWCLFMVAGILEMPLSLLVVFGAMRGEQHVVAQGVMLLVNFVAHSAVVPVLMIGLSLVYFDQRVRQDGLDLLLMLGGGESHASTSVPADTPTTEPAGDAAGL